MMTRATLEFIRETLGQNNVNVGHPAFAEAAQSFITAFAEIDAELQALDLQEAERGFAPIE